MKSIKNYLRIIAPLAALAALLLLPNGCGGEEEKPKAPQVDSAAIKDSLERIERERQRITYHYFPDSGKTNLSKLKEHFSDDELTVIFKLNRIDARNFRLRDSVVVPDTFKANELVYSPFPQNLEEAGDIKKLIVFSHTIQAFAAYDSGRLVKWGPTSLGKKSTPTPNGLYHTNWKAKSTVSTVNSEWILPWAFNLDNFEGISMHEFDLPGYPASHACARLLKDDAVWAYYWAEQWILTKDGESIIAYGTPVIIFGEYDFDSKPPWHFLPQDEVITKIEEDDLEDVLDEYYDTIIRRQEKRDSVIAERERLKEQSKK